MTVARAFGRRQVFGLVDTVRMRTTWFAASRTDPVQCRGFEAPDEFVSTYRCGAAPDSHRLPS